MSTNSNSMPPRMAYSIEEAVVATGLCKSTIRNLMRDGKLKSVHVLRRVLIPVAELQKLIETGDHVT